MTKTKKFVTRILPVIAVLAILVTSIVLITGCSSDNFVPLDTSKLELFDYRVGFISGDTANNTVDLTKAIPGASNFVVEDTTKATVSGTTLTAVAPGETKLTYTAKAADNSDVSKTVNLHVLDGYSNVTDWDTLYSKVMVSGESANVCIQSEMTATAGKGIYFVPSDYDNYKPHPSTLNLYGNLLTIDASPITEGNERGSKDSGRTLFSIEYEQAEMNLTDLHIIGEQADVGEDGSINLVQFEGNGTFFVAYGSDDVTPVINLTHCLAENAQKCAYVRSAELNITGCIMRNGADALVAAETGNTKGAVVNVENSVFANSVVAGIILCGWTKISGPEDFCTVNLSGFVDFYNWKNRETTQLMPNNEQWATIVNPVVKGEIQAGKNDKYFVKKSASSPLSEQYLNVCIIRISSGGQANESTVNGIDAQNLMMDTFPLPDVASTILKSCHVITTQQNAVNWDSNGCDNPTSQIADNPNLNYELVHGREA
mgnify:CR=1 FL=1